MQRVKNKAYAGKELRVGAKTFQADDNGVFDVPDDVAGMLLGMPNFHIPRITVEVREAEAQLRKARKALKEAEDRHDVAVRSLQIAQTDADRGGGTEIDANNKPVKKKRKKASEPLPAPEPEDEEEPEEDEEGAEEGSEDEEEGTEIDAESDEDDEDEEDEDEEEDWPEQIQNEMEAAGKGRDFSMRWSLDALIRFCKANGIAANATWAKADCIRELEELFG